MQQKELTRIVRDLHNENAHNYEDKQGHGFAGKDEENAWQQDINELAVFQPGMRCLEVASGTGVLTRLLVEWAGPNGHVTALDHAEQMLSKNKELLPSGWQDRVSFVCEDADTFQPDGADQQFELIACRQGVIFFADPLAVFGHWHRWLKDGGKVVILDGLWTRSEWVAWENLIDQLPLSCIQTLATVPYLLRKAGFEIEKCQYMNRVNTWYRKTQGESACSRYIIVASKTRINCEQRRLHCL
jgi:ubiquinone/menaquinone biosynthesis C-methylase UbiE